MTINNTPYANLKYLLTDKVYSVINIIGLGLSLSAFMLLALFLHDQFTYDSHWRDADRIYRVNQEMVFPDEIVETAPGSLRLLPALRSDFGAVIESGSRLTWMSGELQAGEARRAETLNMVDREFLDLFQLEAVYGNLRPVLASPNRIALSEQIASDYFGDANPVGEVMTYHAVNGEAAEYEVAAVYRFGRNRTALDLDNFVLFDDSEYIGRESWFSVSSETFIKLIASAPRTAIEAELPAFVDRSVNLPPGIFPEASTAREALRYHLQAIGEIYLNPVDNPNFPDTNSGNKTTITVFLLISVLVLFIGCSNFISLSSARATRRAKEVGVRKLAGAGQGQLVVQFLSESMILSLLAACVALVLAEALLPYFQAISGRSLALPYDSPVAWLSLCGLTLSVGLAGGLYPALILSRFRPSRALHGTHSGDASSPSHVRSLLVILQFSIAIGLIIATAVIYAQLFFTSRIDPGFDYENRLVIENVNRPEVNVLKESLKQEILALSMVRSAGYSDIQANGVNSGSASVGLFRARGDTGRGISIPVLSVGHEFLSTYGIPLLAGRHFAPGRDVVLRRPAALSPVERETQAAAERSIIINESAAGLLGFAAPEDAVGEYIQTGGTGTDNTDNLLIVGVAADSQFKSLREEPGAEIYQLFPEAGEFLTIRYQGDDQAVFESVKEVWNRVLGDAAFAGGYVEDNVAAAFALEIREGKILGAFSFLAILIACLGLYGAAAFTVEYRTKEIGLRKAIGAGVREIVALLAWQFSKPVLLANAIAWPAAMWAMLSWLQRFPYQMDTLLFIPLCALAGIIALVIAWLTVGGKAVRAASTHPVRALRYE